MSLMPTHPHGQRLADLFSYRWAFLQGSTEDTTDPKWETITKHPLRPRVLWNRHQDAAKLIGVRFGSRTRYALLDLDASSPYIDLIDSIKLALETIGIVRTITIRSSFSGGIHLYLPLPEPVRTFSLACAVKDCLEAQGFAIAPGQLEVFPNCKPFGNWWKGEFYEYNGHRLPLQPASGSCMLDEDLNPMPNGEDLSIFFAAWDNCALLQDTDTLNEALSVARANKRNRLRKRAVGPVEKWRRDLEATISEGWTDHGQTNSLLKEIACYGRVFERLSGAFLAEYVERIATTRPGYQQWCRHQGDIWRRACAWARAAEKYYWPLGSSPARETKKYNPNAVRAVEARQRIATAIQELRFRPPFKTIREFLQAVIRLAQCSMTTLYKNRDLWPPVTPDRAGDTLSPEECRALLLDYLESTDKSGVTGARGENEVCSPEDHSQKFLTQGEKGGRRGEKGVFHNE